MISDAKACVNCWQPHWSKGYCKGHLAQLDRGQPLRPLQRYAVQWEDRYTVTEFGCWEWNMARNSRKHPINEYGVITIREDGKRVKVFAHRASWERVNGPVPAGLMVLHRCDNPPCVNPDHLFLGDKKANAQDMVAKGRARGRYSR